MNGRLRLRALLTGLVLGLILCVYTPYNNAVLGGVPLGGGHFPLAPFFILAWLNGRPFCPGWSCWSSG
jgi:hypothetical protein